MAEPIARTLISEYQDIAEIPVEISDEDRAALRIISLMDSDSFKELCKLIDSWIEDLEARTFSLQVGDTAEIVGFRTLVTKTVITFLRQVQNAPRALELAKKYDEKRRAEINGAF